MNGNAPNPVLVPAPAHPDDQPQPRYYRVRPRPHRIAGAVLAAVVVAGFGALAVRGDGADSPASLPASQSDDGSALVPGGVPQVGESDGNVVEPQLPIVPLEAELDVDSVTVVGDSITEASAEAIRATLAAEGVATVDVQGRARRRIEVGNGGREEPLSGIKEIYQLIRDGADPDLWVIALGTNDVSLYPDAAAYGELIDTVLGMLPEDVPLVWVDVFRPGEAEHTAMFNAVLAERIDERGNAGVAPWNAYASARGQTILRSDDLHPNAAGTEVFASVIAATIDDVLDD